MRRDDFSPTTVECAHHYYYYYYYYLCADYYDALVSEHYYALSIVFRPS